MPKIILFSHQKGGVGKSTLAYNIAKNICQNAKIGLVDIDPQGSNASVKKMTNEFDIIAGIENFKDIQKLAYDFILVDTPPYIIDGNETLYQIAHLILIPTKAGVFDMLSLEKTIEDIKENKVEQKTMIVFNMVKPNTQITQQALESIEKHHIRISKTLVSDYTSFASSILTKGVEHHHKSQRQMDELTKEILVNL